MYQTFFGYVTLSFFCPFPNKLCIALASQIWEGRKKTKQTTKKTFCCVLAGEANSSKCSLIHYSQTKTALVLRSHMCSWNSQISSDRVGPDASHSQVKAGGNSDQPQVFLCIICTRCHGKCCLLVDARWPTLAPLCWCEPGSWIMTHQHGSSGSYWGPAGWMLVQLIVRVLIYLWKLKCANQISSNRLLHLCRPEG